MINYSEIFSEIGYTELSPFLMDFKQQVRLGLDEQRWGDLPLWLKVLENLPDIVPSEIHLNEDMIRIGKAADIDHANLEILKEQLKNLMPWRKGPFKLFDLFIDTEWRSDFKWNRLKNHITSLKDALVLDIGCGSGYHCLRMHAEGAKMVIGIDPTVLYIIQFYAMQKYIQQPSVAAFPIDIENMPHSMECFDSVFSMGLLYHRRSPLDHLLQCQQFMKEGGELILETLVIDGKEGESLTPSGRYAKMPNVWFIPSVLTLESWLKKLKFKNVRCIDINQTSVEEQRATKWMGFQSLKDFLDPEDVNLTVEGYPAPKRAIILAKK